MVPEPVTSPLAVIIPVPAPTENVPVIEVLPVMLKVWLSAETVPLIVNPEKLKVPEFAMVLLVPFIVIVPEEAVRLPDETLRFPLMVKLAEVVMVPGIVRELNDRVPEVIPIVLLVPDIVMVFDEAVKLPELILIFPAI